MVASSILPIAIHNGELYFLFGKENQMEDSAKGFSDFGGRVENGESILQTAYREGSEELCGFLGDEKSIRQLLQKNGYIKHSHDDYHIHIFPMKYDENLPHYFTNHHHFVWNLMDKKILNDSKIYEKQEIRWFSVSELLSKRNEFRSFYREIVDELKKRVPEIKRFASKNTNKTNKNHLHKKHHRTTIRGKKFMGIFNLPYKGG
jgi:ADP-ribose pyrophosphatase YjhB (NUDIX family)